MTYTIEKARNRSLEDTAIPNIFIADILPDVPDADFVKIYIYAYMCVKSGEEATHLDIAERLALSAEKIIAAWKYFESRKIVRLTVTDPTNPLAFEVGFEDIRGKLYVGSDSGPSAAQLERASAILEDSVLKTLLSRVAHVTGAPAMSGKEALVIAGWIADFGATPELVEYAYKYSRDTAGHTRTDYVGKIVRTWTEKGFKSGEDVGEYLAATDIRFSFYKQLMSKLGMKYTNLTESEKNAFDLWVDDYGYSRDRLLELADKTAGAQNKFQYLSGIIKKERAEAGKAEASRPEAGGAKGARAASYRAEREKNEKLQEARTEEIYEKLPEVKKIDDEISYLRMEMVKAITSGGASKASVTARTNAEMKKRMDRRGHILLQAGYSEDYTDNIYSCRKCKDTGKLENGADCDCKEI
ncbi:MAG: DnaD domain protein [Clostridiales Family XIII bacterium]|nr:DnaD domain protein [Clostridiales Family XIII bacterium]